MVTRDRVSGGRGARALQGGGQMVLTTRPPRQLFEFVTMDTGKSTELTGEPEGFKSRSNDAEQHFLPHSGMQEAS